MPTSRLVTIIGAGLAGCEAAWQAARLGAEVELVEMRPLTMTAAHTGPDFAELVCSNSLGSNSKEHPSGELKEELRKLDSLILKCADACSVPAGGSLSVDRRAFSAMVRALIAECPAIKVTIREVDDIKPGILPAVLASGPLTAPRLAEFIRSFTGEDSLYMYDAVAPIISADSIDIDKVYAASRYGKGSADYLNCPMDEKEYGVFYEALISAERAPLGGCDELKLFEACMPIEEMARRGKDTIRFGPLKPVGLADPRTGKLPHAVVQLRREDLPGKSYNLVGFQTRLKWSEQKRVFMMIPGLENARFVRYGVMHRNTYLDSPKLLGPDLMFKARPGLFAAGQLTGSEGYTEATATGALAGINAAKFASGAKTLTMPEQTCVGALAAYVSKGKGGRFDPMGICFGILPDPPGKFKSKNDRRRAQLSEADKAYAEFIERSGL